jgi:nicotinamide riboside transporter PnuC
MKKRLIRLSQLRLSQRLAIFGLGIVSVWLIVFVVFDLADRRLPWAVALQFQLREHARDVGYLG